MKNLALVLFIFFVFSCTNNKTVFWCGDHACINKKEKEAYFKKTMTMEIKSITNKNKKDYSSNEKILQQINTDAKKRVSEKKKLAKQLKLEEKMRVKKEKKLAKQLKLEEKMRVKKEKKLTKELKSKNKKKIVNEDKLTKQTKLKKNVEISPTIFTELKEKIFEKNLFRPYPDINDIQN